MILKIGIQCWKPRIIKLFSLYPYYISSPLWFYYDRSIRRNHKRVIEIYISLWFYYDVLKTFPTKLIYTIYISLWFYYDKVLILQLWLRKQFTFHSDSIMTARYDIILVLADKFTFHSDSIMTETAIFTDKFPPIFTFHSDSIMTNAIRKSRCRHHKIYISLWFYYDLRISWKICQRITYLHFTLILLWQFYRLKRQVRHPPFTFHSDSIMTSARSW